MLGGASKEYYFGRTVVRVRHRSGHLASKHNEKGVLDHRSSIVSFFEREDKGKLITTYSAVSVSIACMVYFLLYGWRTTSSFLRLPQTYPPSLLLSMKCRLLSVDHEQKEENKGKCFHRTCNLISHAWTYSLFLVLLEAKFDVSPIISCMD